jgi:hypothetical protein
MSKISDETLKKAEERYMQLVAQDEWSDARVELFYLLCANHERLSSEYTRSACEPLTGTYVRAYNEEYQAIIVQQYLD